MLSFYFKRAVFSILVFLLNHCSPQAQPNQSTALVTIPLEQALTTLDPWLCTSESCAIVISASHRRLYRVFEKEVVGDLVIDEQRFTGKTILKLIEGLTFNDGTSLTAPVIEEYFSRFRSNGRQEWILQGVRSVKSKGMFELEVKHQGSFDLIKSRLALPQMSIFKRKNNEILSLSPVSVTIDPDRVLLSDNEFSIHMPIIVDAASRYFFFRSGYLDSFRARGIYRMLPLPGTDFKQVDQESLSVLYGAIVAGSNRALRSLSFRQRLNREFDRNAICTKSLLSACLPLAQPVPISLSSERIDSAKLWNNANQDFPRANIIVYTAADRDRQLIATYLVSVIKSLGLSATSQVLENATLYRYNNEQRPGIYLLKWVADYPHAENFLMPLFYSKNSGSGGNRAWFNNPSIDYQLLSSKFNPESVTQLQEAIIAKAPWVFIGSQQERLLKRKKATTAGFPINYYEWHPSVFDLLR